MRNNFPKIVFELMKIDKKLFCLLGDIGVFSFRDIFLKYKKRIINVGTLEQSLIGIAAGLSKGGFNPIIHSISPFLVLRALEQIKIDFVYNNLNCNIVTVGGSNDYSKLGSTHHCFEDINILSSYKNINIFTPTNGIEFEYLFKKNYQKGINYFRIISNTQENIFKNNGFLKNSKNKKLIIFFGYFSKDIFNSLDCNFYYINKFNYKFNKKKFIKFEEITIIEPFFGEVFERYLRRDKNFLNKKINTISYKETIIHKYGSKDEQDKYLNFNESKILDLIINEKSLR